MLACTKRDIEIVTCLVNAGATIQLKNKDGWNCFHIACRLVYKLQFNSGIGIDYFKRIELHLINLQLKLFQVGTRSRYLEYLLMVKSSR